MEPNRVANRSNEPARVNELPRLTPLEQGSRMPLLPTSKPRREARRRGPINPIYLLLITALPLIILAVMVWASANLFRQVVVPGPEATAVITPGNDLATKVSVQYSTDVTSYTRKGDIVVITGQVTNNTSAVVHNVTLKAFLYGPAPTGGQQFVGEGIGWANGDIAPQASTPFTVTAQIGISAPAGPGTPTPVPPAFTSVQVLVDQVWAPPTATP